MFMVYPRFQRHQANPHQERRGGSKHGRSLCVASGVAPVAGCSHYVHLPLHWSPSCPRWVLIHCTWECSLLNTCFNEAELGLESTIYGEPPATSSSGKASDIPETGKRTINEKGTKKKSAYKKADITNTADNKIRQELDNAESLLDKVWHPPCCLLFFHSIEVADFNSFKCHIFTRANLLKH